MLNFKCKHTYADRNHAFGMSASTFSDRLRQAMAYAKRLHDRQWLADRIGITHAALTQAMNGQTKALKAENTARAARVLGVDHYWLATGEGDLRPDMGNLWRDVARNLATALDAAERGQRYALFCNQVDSMVERAEMEHRLPQAALSAN